MSVRLTGVCEKRYYVLFLLLQIIICIFVCPDCGELFAPEDGTDPKGTKAKLTRGICPVCGLDFSTIVEEDD